ncbi:MAG: hypothetical protein ACRBBK_03275 [Paracoccaceae bacterium]
MAQDQTQRFIGAIRALACALPLAFSTPSLAHSDHGSAQFDAQISQALMSDKGAQITLSLTTSHENGAVLSGLYSDFGTVAAEGLPLTLQPNAAPVEISAFIEAHEAGAPTPGIFVVVLDLGDAGIGQITITPGL